MSTIGAIYQDARQTLRAAGMETPDLDAKLLISYALGCAPDDVILKPDTPAEVNNTLRDAVSRRMHHEPVSKIVGTREFYGLPFHVTKDVLDPRPDTETLVDAARIYIGPNARILDLCTGSGCILATLLTLYPDATGVGSDISEAALKVADENLRRNNVEKRASLIKSDYLESVNGTFDLIVCNPPYIKSAVVESLDADVRLYDPHLALNGGEDGFTPYKIVFPQIRNYMNGGAHALFEFGAGQGDDIARLAENVGLQVIARKRDLGGHERVVVLR